MRRFIVIAAASVVLVACSAGSGRDFARYYDPQGLFTTNLPAANVITVTPPQPASAGAPGLLAGVIAAPPQPSPSASTGTFGGGLNLGQTAPADQTIYEAFAVTTDTFQTLGDMSLFFLTGDPAIDLQQEASIRIDGQAGKLVVADVTQGGQVTSSVAAAFTLGRGGTGYLIAAVFPPGGWDKERDDFMRVLASFRAGVPPGLDTFPLTGGTAS